MSINTDDHLLFSPPAIDVEHRDGGVSILRSREALGPSAPSLAAVLRQRAVAHPDRPYLAERDGTGEWRTVTYAEMLAAAESIGEALLNRGLGPHRTVMTLSGNSIAHAQLMFGCYLAGVPFTPTSVAYSLMSTDHSKLRHVAAKVRPGLVFAESSGPFGTAIENLVAHLEEPAPERVSVDGGGATTALSELLAVTPGAAVRESEKALHPDVVAKYLFTSGSTGTPKGVPTTHRMLSDNQQAIRQVWPFLVGQPPVLVDWLPWSHTFGGSHNFNLVLSSGGTMYIDAGKPVPGLIEATVRNIRDVSPTLYFNVPAGFAALLPFLEADRYLAAAFFARLQLIFYAAAALPADTWRRLEKLSLATTGRVVPMTSAWGSTETSPLSTSAHFPLEAAGNIGVPIPGVELKVLPNGGKLEVRVRGSNVMAGYLDEPLLSAQAFDEEGFYRIGDAVRFVDPEDPAAGILFDGRIAEDFKLTTGTWVNVGSVRTELISAVSPVVSDAVIAGHDRDTIAALVWLTPAAGAHLGVDGDATVVAAHPLTRAFLRERIAEHNKAAGGSSHAVRRVLVLVDPPSIDHNEITDKGCVNQRAVLDARKALVERLHSDDGHPDVIEID